MENIEIKKFGNAINFTNLLVKENQLNFQSLLVFLAKFKYIYNKEKEKLPYHINLIDELHANENAHSRIFAQLLRYKEKDTYPFLDNFLNDVCGFNIKIETPEIKKVDSCGRIDIPIFDKEYVVIIENKVTDRALDQNGEEGGQLARYIEIIKEKYKRELQTIFVIYTPKYTREPSSECWENKDNVSYKDVFKDRFRSLSYRDVIYPWFKNIILPIIDAKNIYLRSAVEQYTDYLEGIFNLRNIDKKMNMELQKFIKKELELQDDNPKKAMELLLEKEMELNETITQIQQLKNKYQRQIIVSQFDKWGEQLKEDFASYNTVGDKFNINQSSINIGIKFNMIIRN